jgi:hypothetical protein
LPSLLLLALLLLSPQLVRYHSSFESFDRSIRQAFQPNSVGSTGAFGVARFAPVTFDFELEAKKSIEDLADDELKGKKVLIRCDVNVLLMERPSPTTLVSDPLCQQSSS